jgi:putative nucleotidyltransferase with HDIG domain
VDRSEALALLREHTTNEALIRHALAVEAAMRFYARLFGEDEELWGIVGLLHDLDWERYPDLKDHPFRGAEILRQRGYPETVVRAVLAHADHTGVPRRTPMERALFAVDELTGFILAVAMVRPSRRLAEVDVASVQKKLKDKAFARGVKREDVRRGAAELGIALENHIGNLLLALETIAADIGL